MEGKPPVQEGVAAQVTRDELDSGVTADGIGLAPVTAFAICFNRVVFPAFG